MQPNDIQDPMSLFRPLVSIVIPVFNGSNYLATAIESALAQTYERVEVIVVDDGSTDDGATAAVAASFGDRIRYYRKPNGGVSSALNAGIAQMSGEYFSWLSHDDRYLPAKLQRQVEYLADAPEIKVLATGLEVIDNAGAVTSSYSCGDVKLIRNGRDVMDHWVYGCSLLIHKAVFDRVGGFNEQNRTVQDLEMWLKMVNEGATITMLPDVLCQWRHHGESDSYRLRPAHLRELDVFLRQIATTYPLGFFSDRRQDPDAKEMQQIFGWFANHAMNRGSPPTAFAFYRKALVAYPNIFSLSLWRMLRRYLSGHRLARDLRTDVDQAGSTTSVTIG